MAFNNQHTQSQMPGAFPDAERDEFGFTEADYEQMMNEVTVTCVDGHYGVVPVPQPGASNDALESRCHTRGRVQPDIRTDQPGVSHHDGGNLSSQGGARYPQLGGYQQVVPPIESRNHTRRRVQPDSGTDQPGFSSHDGGYLSSHGYPQHGSHQQTGPPIESRSHARTRIQPESRTDQPGASSHNGGYAGTQGGARFHQHRNYQQSAPPNRFATVQPDNRTDQPGLSTQDRGNLSSQGGATYHQPGNYQPVVPPNPFATFGNTYPAPPIGWESGSDFPSEEAFQDSRSNSFGGHASTSRSTPFAQHGTSRSVATRYDAPSSYPPSQHTLSAYTPSPYARSPYEPSPYAQSSYAPSGNAPPPYADNASYLTTHSRPRTIARPHQRRLQTQPSRRKPTVPVEDNEIEESEDSIEEEENEEAGENEELTTTTKKKKTKKASKATQEPRTGLTRVNEYGELEWFAKLNSEGVLAVRHDDIRPQLIATAEAERVALGVKYAHPDEPGWGRHNVTSFYRKHVHWGPKRKDRPQNLFAWEEDNKRNPRPKCPGDMYWEEAGKKYIVLDPHDNPVKNWDLPLTIASNIPGYKLEAMRRDNMSLKHKDFWARMPSRINVGTREEPIWQELGHTNSVINMPIERFRFRAGLCSWRRRTGTLKIKEGLKKLYGDKIQNNTVRAFGRDLTNREIIEIKKGEEAKFPIEDDAIEDDVVPKKRKRKGPAIEEDTQTRIRPRKRARREREEASIASEIDDLGMQMPTIDHGHVDRRYSLRSTQKAPKKAQKKAQKVHRTVEPVEELGNQSSTGRDPHSESNEFGSALQASSLEIDDDEERTSPRVPFRRIPGEADVGGKCKGPSWVSSTSEEEQSSEERDRRKAVIPLNIGGRVHYATYEGLISNGPLQCDGASDALPQRQDPDTTDGSLQQNEYESPWPHPFDLAMNAPVFGHENTEEEDTLLQAHRKRVREFLEEEPEAQAPPSKRLRTEQQVVPLPGPATHEATVSVPAQTASPPINQPQIDRNGRAPPIPQAQASKTREQKLDAEWAKVFEQTFLDLGFQSVNYSEVCPWSDEEVQSLIDALLPTRELYFAWTGEPAPRTDPHQSYRAQFDTIFVAFQDWWETYRSNEDLPILSGVMHWGRSVDDWIPPSKDSIYYEAFEKGHRAHRGGPSACSGPRLEDASRIPY